MEHPRQFLYSEPSATTLHQSSISSSSLSSNEQNGTNEYEKKMMDEVEIIDEHGNIIRIEKMKTKNVNLLSEGEKILVHVNKFYQPIKSAGGLCTRFMARLLKEPNMSPSEASDWQECKVGSDVKLLAELRRRFSLPQSENVDKVLFSIWGGMFRSVKSNLKKKLFELVAKGLNKLNNMGDDVTQVRVYTNCELLEGLELIKAPSNFTDIQWELYKNHLREPTTKKLPECGKRARADQVYNLTTGGCSYTVKRKILSVLKHCVFIN